MIELNIDPEYGVYADVTLTVDATNVEDTNSSIESFESSFEDQWNVDIQSVFITSTPTKSPSVSPIVTPTTLRPSAKPTITGLVVILEVNYS